MDKDIIQAYLWDEAIRIGFSPSSDKERKNWVIQYGKSLKEFWGVGEYPSKINTNSIVISHSNINLEYRFNNLIKNEKYTIELYFLSNSLELIWTHDVDQNYFLFPEKLLLNKYKRLTQAKKEFKKSAPSKRSKLIEEFLTGLFFHPTVHQHIKSPIDEHEIRIGGGLYNPFVYLYHLRFQLCPDNTKRVEEKTRLVGLFEDAIQKGRNIPPNELFN